MPRPPAKAKFESPLLRAAALLSLLAASGCGKLLSDGDYAVGGAGESYAGPISAFPADCRTCIESTCPDQLAACAADATCDAWARCLVGPVDPARGLFCAAGVSTQAGPAVDLAKCVLQRCPDCERTHAWECVGNYTWPEPNAPTATLHEQFLHLLDSKPLVGLTVTACDLHDVACTNQPPLDLQTSDAQGWVTLTLPMRTQAAFGLGQNGFDGFIQVVGPDIVSLRFHDAPFVVDREYASEIASWTETAKMAESFGVPADSARGIVVVEIVDCFSQHAPGAILSLAGGDASTVPFYFDQGYPSHGVDRTTTDGTGGFVNVPVGTVTVTATLADGSVIATGLGHVRPSAVTDIVLYPERR